ncbi:MAG TPA: class I poly(R)-hydroxyalkanoic acid synthase [Caulobacteraceae bacterium]|nr:class I poly(R)-hydroxyalkanoic acid synthase [Caulobacteraceae bacterium]
MAAAAGTRKGAKSKADKKASDKKASGKKGKKGSDKTKAAKAQKTEAKPEAATLPPHREGPAPKTETGSASDATSWEAALLDPSQREAVEALSMNLAKAALTAQGAIAEAALSQADAPRALSPDPFHVGPAMGEVMTRLASSPDKLFKAQADLFSSYMDLWQNAARRAVGETPEPAAAPAKGDKRFNDKDWSENPVFDVVKQSYLVSSNWLNSLVSGVEGVDPLTKRRAEFFTKLLTDAFSPTNFLASNPAALRELAATKGESLVKGMEQFAADIERGGGKLAISQTDYSRFHVGENVATAPGKVVWRDELYELLQFTPTTDKQRDTPLLIFPPWINKFYILDLRPENSMIRWLTDQGFTVFVTSWVNPDQSLRDRDFADYMKGGIYSASAKVMEHCGVDRVNAVGYCIGGTLLGATLAHMAAQGDKRFNAVTFFAAQHDFSEAGDLLLFTDEAWLKQLEDMMDAAGGVLPGAAMADTFNALRSNDLVWSFFVNNYLMGKAPPSFDLLYWNSDQTRMPKALHLFYLRQFYGLNAFSKGELVLDGVKLDARSVKQPMYFQASKEDHIAPARSVYKSAKMFGGDVTYTLAGSGHIAGVVNPPAANKYQHWESPKLPPTFEEWFEGAVEKPGSWWPHWAGWLHPKSGDWIEARDPTKGKLRPLGDAPGDYVKVRS